MDIDEFLNEWNKLVNPIHIRLKNDAVYYTDMTYFFKTLDGIERLDLYLNNKMIGYCNLADIIEVY